jgi:hypothetical protein
MSKVQVHQHFRGQYGLSLQTGRIRLISQTTPPFRPLHLNYYDLYIYITKAFIFVTEVTNSVARSKCACVVTMELIRRSHFSTKPLLSGIPRTKLIGYSGGLQGLEGSREVMSDMRCKAGIVGRFLLRSPLGIYAGVRAVRSTVHTWNSATPSVRI